MLRTVILPLLLVSALLAAAPEAAPPANAPATEAPAAAPGPSAASPAPAAPAAPSALAALLARADAAYARRDQPAELEASLAALTQASQLAPNDAQVLWRLARHEVWLAEDPAITDAQKSEHGKRAWDLGERAIAADPTPVEPWFWAVSGMGTYSLGIGILSALSQGIEGKFRGRLLEAEKRDQNFQRGAIYVAWARFYFKLPWPKHDAGKSERMLRAALNLNPDNVRARVYLAELYADKRRYSPAVAEYRAALAKPPGQYDPPEERRWQEAARAGLAQLEAKQ
jgi:tetratricopeptide (TPR) repeat protein